jgi:hypothetical protein
MKQILRQSLASDSSWGGHEYFCGRYLTYLNMIFLVEKFLAILAKSVLSVMPR